MHSEKLVAVVAASLLAAIALAACSVKQKSSDIDQSVDIVWPSKPATPPAQDKQ